MSRACPAITDAFFIRYHLPQEQGWAYIHEYLLGEGCDMRWPSTHDNPEGRWWQRILKSLKK